MESNEEIIQLLRDIRGVLACHQTSGVAAYPASPELASFLELSAAEGVEVPPRPVQKEKAAQRTEQGPGLRKSNQTVLAEIGAEVVRCESCALSAGRPCVVPGHGGGGNIRLLLIGHWLPVTDAHSSRDSVFGVEEDLMLARMLAAIHLPMEEVFVTNVIKCGVGPDSQPQAEHIDACGSYLRRQITAVAPQLICTMGMVATRALLRMSQPLSRLRGRFYSYQGADGLEIPLLPTFHPTYLLQNPEMKQATWLDLQALEKRLQE